MIIRRVYKTKKQLLVSIPKSDITIKNGDYVRIEKVK